MFPKPRHQKQAGQHAARSLLGTLLLHTPAVGFLLPTTQIERRHHCWPGRTTTEHRDAEKVMNGLSGGLGQTGPINQMEIRHGCHISPE